MEEAGLKELKPAIQNLARELASRSRKEGAILIDYTNDDARVWKHFRRELVKQRLVSSDVIREKVDLIIQFVLKLGEQGLLDESQVEPPDVAAPTNSNAKFATIDSARSSETEGPITPARPQAPPDRPEDQAGNASEQKSMSSTKPFLRRSQTMPVADKNHVPSRKLKSEIFIISESDSEDRSPASENSSSEYRSGDTHMLHEIPYNTIQPVGGNARTRKRSIGSKGGNRAHPLRTSEHRTQRKLWGLVEDSSSSDLSNSNTEPTTQGSPRRKHELKSNEREDKTKARVIPISEDSSEGELWYWSKTRADKKIGTPRNKPNSRTNGSKRRYEDRVLGEQIANESIEFEDQLKGGLEDRLPQILSSLLLLGGEVREGPYSLVPSYDFWFLRHTTFGPLFDMIFLAAMGLCLVIRSPTSSINLSILFEHLRSFFSLIEEYVDAIEARSILSARTKGGESSNLTMAKIRARFGVIPRRCSNTDPSDETQVQRSRACSRRFWSSYC